MDKSIVVSSSVQQNPAVVFLSGQIPVTRYAYHLDLQSISSLLGYEGPCMCPWGALRFQHTQAIRTALTEMVSGRTGRGLAVVTVNRKLCVLRGVLKTAWRLGQMDAESYYRAIDVQSIKGQNLPGGRGLTRKEIARLMDVCSMDPTSMGSRDATIISLAYSCGLRRSEITGLDLDDYDPCTGQLKVLGKRNKERVAYLVGGAAQAMKDWIHVRGDWDGPLFTASNGGFWGAEFILVRRRISSQGLYNMLARRGRQAGLEEFSPHDLRRTFVSHLLDAGVDISTVSRMCGHSNVATTMRYDHRPEVAKMEAAKLLRIHYKRRIIKP